MLSLVLLNLKLLHPGGLCMDVIITAFSAEKKTTVRKQKVDRKYIIFYKKSHKNITQKLYKYFLKIKT